MLLYVSRVIISFSLSAMSRLTEPVVYKSADAVAYKSTATVAYKSTGTPDRVIYKPTDTVCFISTGTVDSNPLGVIIQHWIS